MKKAIGLGALALACILAMGQGESAATVIVFRHGLEFSGTRPAGAAPWLTATIDDHGSAGSVTLTLEATNLTDGEFVSAWYFNLDPNLAASGLIFSAPTKTGLFDSPTIDVGTNDFKADGDGRFDILLSFTTNQSGDQNRFTADDVVSYTVTGPSALTASSFSFLSASSPGSGYPTAAHVQGVGSTGGWVTVPEPGTLLLLLACAVPALRRRRREARA